MSMMEKISIPKELQENKSWICYKTENIENEVIYTPVDPVSGETIKVNDKAYWMGLEEALDFKENVIDVVDVGYVLQKSDDLIAIEIYNAIDNKGVMTEVAKKTLNLLEDSIYAEINGSTLIILAKGSINEKVHFKNIEINYHIHHKIVPINCDGKVVPNYPWTITDNLIKVKAYHQKLNFKVDENSIEIPEYYTTLKNGGLKLWPNVLVKTMLTTKDWLVSNGYIYVRDKGGNIYRKYTTDKIDTEIIDYLSEKYLKNAEIEETKKLLMKQIRHDDELLSPQRISGKINLLDVVYDVQSNTTSPYSSSYHTAHQINVKFNKNARCETFLQYLSSSLDAEDIKTIQELVGYLLTTDMKAEKAFLLYGPGRTGKSTLISVIEHIIGTEYVSNIPFQDLNRNFRTVQLYGKLLNTFSDLPQGGINDTSVFKTLVTGDRIHADEKYEKGISFSNTARLLFASNTLPANLVDHTSGFYRRLIIVPFLKIVQNDEVDRDLKSKILDEKEGVVNWALQGLQRLISNNYTFSQSKKSRELLKKYEINNNNVLWYIKEYCDLDAISNVAGGDLYKDYKIRCLETKVGTPVSQRLFYTQIEAEFNSKGVIKRMGSKSRAVEFEGLKLRTAC